MQPLFTSTLIQPYLSFHTLSRLQKAVATQFNLIYNLASYTLRGLGVELKCK